MATEAKIKEIFSSIQGEGPVVGYKQLFIRFCGCNLSCNYCDTDYQFENSKVYTPNTLIDYILSEYDLSKLHSISLTGGEPLLYSAFLTEFLNLIKMRSDIKIYLETNATLTDELLKIKDKIDIISADIKLKSATGKDTFDKHSQFLKICKGIETFAKVVFDNNITDDEILKSIKIAKENDIELILQPKMNEANMSINSDICMSVMDKFLEKYSKVRLIPQTHKFLNVR